MNTLESLATTIKGVSLSNASGLRALFGEGLFRKSNHTGYVAACLNTMGNYFAKAKFRLYEMNGDNPKEIFDHPFLDLLENPNEVLVENEIKHYMGEFFGVKGNYYLQKDRGSFSGKIRRWIVLDPTTIIPKSSSTKLIDYYEHRLPNGKVEKIAPEDIMHFKYLSAYSMMAGIPLINSISNVLNIDAYQTAYMEEFYQNGGFLGQVFTTDQQMTPANFKRAKEELRKEYAGKGNSHKLALFDSGLKPEKAAYSLKDMEMTASRELTLAEVMTAFRIPQILLGGKGDTYTFATAKASEYTYSSSMIDPALSYVDQVFSKHVRMDYKDPKLKVVHDPVSPKDVEENLKYYKDLAGLGALTINEIRVMENFDKLSYRLADVPILNVGGGAIDIAEEEIIGKGANAELPRAEEPKSIIPETTIEKSVLDLHWKQANRRIDEGVRYIQRRINEFFDGQKERLLKVLDLKSPLAETFFESLDEIVIINNLIENSWMRMFEKAMAFSGGTNINDPRVRIYLQQFLERSTSINETTKKELLKLGLTKENIENAYKNFKEVRSQVIAQTTAVGAFNFGLWLGYKQQGYTHKIWVSQLLPETRESHSLADGQRVKIDEPFLVGSSLMQFPGDSTAPPEEVINCLCVLIGSKGE